MLITKVILQDYGVYRGRNEFDFAPTRNKPIVLVGGTNGAGKTTLFESITLCLYGISTMEKRCTKKTYEQFLHRKIHRYLKSATTADHAAITVQFKFFHNGQETEYSVERSWNKEDGRINEHLNIQKRHQNQKKFSPLETVEKSYWQSFIEDLIPRGIVNLFFFDGEKIVEIAKEGTEDVTIRESFKALLGIELVEQLYTDLQVNLTRNLTGGAKALREDFEKYKAEKDESMNTTEKLKERLAQKQTEMDSLRMETDNMESKISKIGGKFASERDSIKSKLASERLAYESIRERLAGLCSGVLPFSMIPEHLGELEQYLREDDSVQQHIAQCKILDIKFKKIMDRISKPDFSKACKIDKQKMSLVIGEFSKILDEEKKTSKPPADLMFGFSYRQAGRIADVIKEANNTALKNLKKDTQKIIQVGEDIAQLEAAIANAPDDDEIGPLMSEIGNLHSQAGTLQAEMDHIEERISSNQSLRNHLDTKLRDIVSHIYKNEKTKQHADMTQNVQNVLEEFIKELKTRKIRLLEQYLLDALYALLHKKDFIKKVKINPDTFEVELFRSNHIVLPKDMLSEGEKQMFAISVLWALAKTSGRPLPFMIDTPLARLDEGHRSNVVEKFLPSASHQILVFSTDTEIENKEYQKLTPHLARAYAMEYQDDTGSTKRHDGYFWNREGKKIVAV